MFGYMESPNTDYGGVVMVESGERREVGAMEQSLPLLWDWENQLNCESELSSVIFYFI